MYVRMARFEGAEPAALERELETMRQQMESGGSGEGSESGQGPNAEQMQYLSQVVKRMLVLADVDKGSSAMLVFVDSEDDARKIDEMFGQMSPGGEGGKRTSADVFEVKIDREMS